MGLNEKTDHNTKTNCPFCPNKIWLSEINGTMAGVTWFTQDAIKGVPTMNSTTSRQSHKADRTDHTIERLQKKFKGIDICPYCAKGITRVGINACMHCKQPLIWYMDVVGKPGDEKICREEYKAKLQVKHPGLANQGWTNINNPWLIASAISLLLAFIFSILLFNQ